LCAIGIDETATNRPSTGIAFKHVDHRLHAALDDGVGIEQQQYLTIGQLCGGVVASNEAKVFK
jgi:hypothetical protein